MAKVIFISFSLLLTLLLGLEVSAQQCSRTKLCANNLCCSQYGYCGSTAEYCCDGCLSQCNCTLSLGVSAGVSVRKIRDSGPEVSAQQCSRTKLCANNLCCSQYGYCGSTAEYCCDGCLSQCNCTLSLGVSAGVSVRKIRPGDSGPEVLQQQCSRTKLCANGLCCSQYGYCGSTDEYCCDGCLSQCNCGGAKSTISEEKIENISQQQCSRTKLCANGLCCSQYGYCGSTDEYCCDGCLSQCNCGGVGNILSQWFKSV